MGIGITRIELDAHCCKTFLLMISASRAPWVLKVQKHFNLINRTDMVKTSLNVAKIQVWVKKMFTNIKVYFKATQYLTIKNYINLFHYTMQLSNINVKYSNMADSAKQGYPFRLCI